MTNDSNGRPISMIAQRFSADLNNAFDMGNSNLDGLLQSVQLKKEAVDSQAKELQALEAQLRDTEELLKERQSEGPSAVGRNNGTESLNIRQPLRNTSGGQENGRLESSPTYSHATQAPSSQSVSASTLAHWRPTQNTASGTNDGSAPFSRPSGQENSGYMK